MIDFDGDDLPGFLSYRSCHQRLQATSSTIAVTLIHVCRELHKGQNTSPLNRHAKVSPAPQASKTLSMERIEPRHERNADCHH